MTINIAEIALQEPLSRIPATRPADLQHSLKNFSAWLSGLEVVQSPRLSQLIIQRMHTKVHQDALARLARTYQRICEEVKRPVNRYEAAATLLGSERPFGQVHLLWQIFGLEEREQEQESKGEEEESDEDDSEGSASDEEGSEE